MTPSNFIPARITGFSHLPPEKTSTIPCIIGLNRKIGYLGNLHQTVVQSRSEKLEKNRRKFITSPPVSPDELFGTINQLNSQVQKFYALIAALEIRLFDYLDEPTPFQELQRLFPHHEMLSSLLSVLVVSSFIQENEGRYHNSPLVSTYFCSTSPYYQGAYLEKIKNRIGELWVHLPAILKNGPVVYNKKEFFCNLCIPPMAENAMTGRLQHVIRSVVSLPEFLNSRRMLDLGGGHGLYAIAFSSLKKDLNCVVFDLPDVIDITCNYIIAHDMDDQVKVLPGDFFIDNFGSGYDIVLSSSNPSGKNPAMVKKIYDALNPGGLFINIQSGDAKIEDNPFSQLESRMWFLEGEPEWKSHRGKQRPFLSPSYMDTVRNAGFEIKQVETIHDGYFEDYSVTMVICKKKEIPADRFIHISIISEKLETKTITIDLNDKDTDWLTTLSHFYHSS